MPLLVIVFGLFLPPVVFLVLLVAMPIVGYVVCIGCCVQPIGAHVSIVVFLLVLLPGAMLALFASVVLVLFGFFVFVLLCCWYEVWAIIVVAIHAIPGWRHNFLLLCVLYCSSDWLQLWCFAPRLCYGWCVLSL